MDAQPFFNEKAERSILAYIATDAAADDLIAQFVASDFYVESHRQIFAAMQKLYAEKKPVDLITLSDAMRSLYGPAEPTLTDALVQIISENQFGAAFTAKNHCEIIKAAALRRQLSEIIDKAKADLLDSGNDTAAVLDTTRQSLRDLVITGHSWKSMADILIETYDALERRAKGEEPSMPSGIRDLDANTTGFHKGELTIIGARPAVGKSAFGAYIALSTAKQGYKVGIVSREMTAPQYGTRILSSGTDVENAKLRTGSLDPDDWDQIVDAMSLFSSLNVSFMFSTRYIEDLRMEVQKQVDAGNLDLLVVDYVQLMQSRQRFDKDYLRIAYVSKALKDMTVDLNIAIIALAQVGRSADGAMPTLSELRGSGDLEQDADNVIFLHRPRDASDRFIRPSDRAMFGNLENNGMQYIAINIAKQRQGRIGTVPVIFNPARMRFTAIERSEPS